MGDIPIGGVIYRWYAMDIDRPDRPNIRKWYDRLSERAGYAEHVQIPLS
jgi:glutathione S-transferase